MTMTKNRRPATEAAITTSDILAEQEQASRRAIAEAALYRRVIREAHAGETSGEDILAAKIIGQRWGWSWDADLAALAEESQLAQKYPDGIQFAADQLWTRLTGQADAIRKLEAETRERLRAMEVERVSIQSQHSAASQRVKRPAELRAKHPHLFGDAV